MSPAISLKAKTRSDTSENFAAGVQAYYDEPHIERTMDQTTEQTLERPAKPASGTRGEMLWEFWYPALRSDQLGANKLRRAVLLDVPLVLGRDSAAKPFALLD